MSLFIHIDIIMFVIYLSCKYSKLKFRCENGETFVYLSSDPFFKMWQWQKKKLKCSINFTLKLYTFKLINSHLIVSYLILHDYITHNSFGMYCNNPQLQLIALSHNSLFNCMYSNFIISKFNEFEDRNYETRKLNITPPFGICSQLIEWLIADAHLFIY